MEQEQNSQTSVGNINIGSVQTEAMNSVKRWLAAKGITAGLTRAQHSGAIVEALVKAGVVAQDNRRTAFVVIEHLENGSQLRQQLEKAGCLDKAATLAQDYAS